MSFVCEVKEQAQVLRDFLRQQGVMDALQEIKQVQCDRVIFTGMGSSYAAGHLSAMLLTEWGINSFVFEPETLGLAFDALINEHTLVVAISQSGNSAETVALAQRIDPKRLIVVTNNTEGKLYSLTTQRVMIHAGTEQHTASKTYTNTIAALYWLSSFLADKGEDIMEKMLAAVDTMQTLIDAFDTYGRKFSVFFDGISSLVSIGSGYSFATAYQADYVVAEMDKLLTKCITSAQYFHGMVESTDRQDCFLVFDCDPRFRQGIDRILNFALERGARCLLITNRDTLWPSRERLMTIPLTTQLPCITPLIDVILLEILGYALGVSRGTNPGDLSYVQK